MRHSSTSLRAIAGCCIAGLAGVAHNGCAGNQVRLTQESWHRSPIEDTCSSVGLPVSMPAIIDEHVIVYPVVPWSLAQKVRAGMSITRIREIFQKAGHSAPQPYAGNLVFYSREWEIALQVGSNNQVTGISYRFRDEVFNWNAASCTKTSSQ